MRKRWVAEAAIGRTGGPGDHADTDAVTVECNVVGGNGLPRCFRSGITGECANRYDVLLTRNWPNESFVRALSIRLGLLVCMRCRFDAV